MPLLGAIYLSVKRLFAMDRSLKIAKLSAVTSLTALLLSFCVPSQTIDNFPLIESVVFFLSAVFWLSALSALFFGFRSWKLLPRLWRFLVLVAPVYVIGIFVLSVVAAPKVKVQVDYQGSKTSQRLFVYFGGSGTGEEIRRDKPFIQEFDEVGPKLTIHWGDESFDEKEKIFDVRKSIPRFGGDRSVKIILRDDDAEMTVLKD